MNPTTPFDSVLQRAQWQSLLSAEQPSRLDVLRLHSAAPLTRLNIRVHRNHAFEHLASVSAPWFEFWGQRAEFDYSDYDDSLSFGSLPTSQPQLEIVWLDLDRYADRPSGRVALAEWLVDRLTALRRLSEAPIILSTVGGTNATSHELQGLIRTVPGARFADVSGVQAQLGSGFYDLRAAKFSGTRLSDRACIQLARTLACQWVPAMLRPRLKAVALDLDHTLYQGVLGEDGDNVELTPAHAEFQRFLVGLRENGLFLALISRNEEADVRELFSRRADFPLRWEHFSAAEVSWQNKAQGLRKIAARLRIAPDTVVMVDDNPGELAALAAELPETPLVCAYPDAAITRRSLQFFPGLWAWDRTETDALRANDLKADEERARCASIAQSPTDYLRSLRIRIRIECAPCSQLGRMHELSQKTNQFNLNLERLTEVQLAQMLASDNHRLAVIGLQDALSDSGLIGFLALQLDGTKLVVRELAISCRALGRQLEDLMVAETVRALSGGLQIEQVEFKYQTGPRNGPARDWLARVSGQPLAQEGTLIVRDFLKRFPRSDYPVDVELIQNEPRRN